MNRTEPASPLSAILQKLKRVATPPLLHTVAEKLWTTSDQVDDLARQMDHLRRAIGRVEERQTKDLPAHVPLKEREFRVYSQWGEDGLLAFLCREAQFDEKVFVEFGVESYVESNTRYLLTTEGWRGLVLDGDAEQVARIKNDPIYWEHPLKADQAFLTRDNLNDVIRRNGVSGRIGVLSIDVDGMDYWLWRAIDVVDPAIVVIEYNSRFGPDASVTVPYQADFDRRAAHHSLIYYGASLRALNRLATAKGYRFIGCGSHGLNAFFVRHDAMAGAIQPVSLEEGFVAGEFSESHDEHGQRVKLSPEEERQLLATLPTVRVDEAGEPQSS
jgi:hypothetical protein